MNIHFLNSGERKRLIADLQERFGISKINYLLLEAGKGKMRAFSGDMSKEEILQLSEIARVELIGIYFARRDEMSGLRLSVDGAILLKDEIDKNVIEIDKAQVASWMRGEDLQIEIEKGVYVVKHGRDVLGCGFSNGKKVYNYVPRERQVRG